MGSQNSKSGSTTPIHGNSSSGDSTRPATGQDATIRDLDSRADFDAALALQHRTWGVDCPECVPPALFMICRKLGGVAAGAFDAQQRMVGLVYGLTGVQAGELVHWSHMLAVDPAWRGQGLGKRLKQFQRDQLVARGVGEVTWTFDPLVARNAYLNINRLGCRITDYLRDVYGDGGGSPLHRGIGTDRLLAVWDLDGEPKEDTRDASWDDAPVLSPIVSPQKGSELPPIDLPEVEQVRIAVPVDIQQLKETNLERAIQYRQSTRRAFQFYLERGYRVERLWRGSDGDAPPGNHDCHYELRRP